ncbi:MAG: DinB family protein [Candidatus Angelobacter sp.]
MPYERTIQAVASAITSTFDELDVWFEHPPNLACYKPAGGGWSINEVLEHVSLTSHFLLIVIRNGTQKALKRAGGQQLPASGESNLELLSSIGARGSFSWTRPEHMVPTGKKLMREVRQTLQQQREECLTLLQKLSHGEGAMFTANMSVAGIGRMDLYQWIYFLVLHARRHIAQMEAIYLEAKQAYPA